MKNTFSTKTDKGYQYSVQANGRAPHGVHCRFAGGLLAKLNQFAEVLTLSLNIISMCKKYTLKIIFCIHGICGFLIFMDYGKGMKKKPHKQVIYFNSHQIRYCCYISNAVMYLIYF